MGHTCANVRAFDMTKCTVLNGMANAFCIGAGLGFWRNGRNGLSLGHHRNDDWDEEAGPRRASPRCWTQPFRVKKESTSWNFSYGLF